MGKRLSKQDLLKEISVETNKLDSLLEKLTAAQMVESGVTPGGWSVKDILAHLIGWQQMILSFHKAEMRGEIPEVPGHGLTWRDTPKLNSMICAEFKDVPLDEILKTFRASHKEMLQLVDDVLDNDFTKVRRFQWLGPSWTVSDYVRAETASHYKWAGNHIKKWIRARSK